MYMSSIVPAFAVGITLNTSMQRQSRYHDGRSLRISATCNAYTLGYKKIAPREKTCTSSRNRLIMKICTFVGSRLTRPQTLAATPLQLRETATIPIDSGPGYKINASKFMNLNI